MSMQSLECTLKVMLQFQLMWLQRTYGSRATEQEQQVLPLGDRLSLVISTQLILDLSHLQIGECNLLFLIKSNLQYQSLSNVSICMISSIPNYGICPWKQVMLGQPKKG